MCFRIFKPKVITELQDFPTYADLEAWFELHKELRMPAPNLCDDYSRESRKLAEIDAYFLSCMLVYQGSLYGAIVFSDLKDSKKPDLTVYHIANMAIVLDSDGKGTEACYYVDLAFNKLLRLCPFISGGAY